MSIFLFFIIFDFEICIFMYLECLFLWVKFEELIVDLLCCVCQFVEQVLSDVKLSVGDINEVILVGGLICIFVVKCIVQDLVGKIFNELVNFDEVVVFGVVVQVGIIQGDSSLGDIVFVDVILLMLGVEVKGGMIVLMIICNIIVFVKKIEIYIIVENNQLGVEINVL